MIRFSTLGNSIILVQNLHIMFKRITKRDILFFFFGAFAMFLIEVIVSWDSAVASVKKGYNDAHEEANIR